MKDLVLGDSLEVLLDHRGKTPRKLGADFTDVGVPVASAMLVANGVVDLAAARKVSPETYEKWMPTATRAGDVLLTSEAPLGRVARVPNDEPLVLGQRLFCLRGRIGVLDSGYLFYALQTVRVQSELSSRSTGSTVVGIRQSALRRVVVPAPVFAEQRAIAEVLGALDDKIAANTRLAMASRDLSAGQFELLRRSSTQEARLGQAVRLEYGKALPATCRKPGSVLVYGSGGVVGLHDTPLVTTPGAVVGRKGTAGAVHWAPGPHFPIDTTFFATPTAEHYSHVFCYFLLRSAHLDEMNSDSAVPGLNRAEAEASWVQMPHEAAIRDFTTQVEPLMELADRQEAESAALIATRDALLPALMSGALRVRDAERVAAELT